MELSQPDGEVAINAATPRRPSQVISDVRTSYDDGAFDDPPRRVM